MKQKKTMLPNLGQANPNLRTKISFFRKIKFIVIILILIHCLKSNAQIPTTYWYNQGIADSVYYQTDVFSFRCFNGTSYSGTYNSSIIDSIVYRSGRRDLANDVFFNPSTTLIQRLNEAQNIYATGLVEMVYLNVSALPNMSYSSNQ